MVLGFFFKPRLDERETPMSGSLCAPLIDATGQVLGAVFDGNIHSLGGAYAYDPVLNRAVTASTAAGNIGVVAAWSR